MSRLEGGRRARWRAVAAAVRRAGLEEAPQRRLLLCTAGRARAALGRLDLARGRGLQRRRIALTGRLHAAHAILPLLRLLRLLRLLILVHALLLALRLPLRLPTATILTNTCRVLTLNRHVSVR